MTGWRTDLAVRNLVGTARWAWRQLTSMRTALLLLMLLAVVAVPGSLFPQRPSDPGRVDAYLADHPAAGPWLDRLGAFDVYASPWFSAVYLLLAVSLVGCLVPRIRRHGSQLLAPPPRIPRRLDRFEAYRRQEVADATARVLERAGSELRRDRYRVRAEPDGFAAERGYLRETGNLVFHLGLLALLVAVAGGSFLRWTGQALVVVGDGFANTLPMYDSFQAGRRVDPADLRPFSLTLDELQVRFEERSGGSQFGAPREFRATVRVQESPGAAGRREVLEVNHPLRVGGARVFLVGNGYAPVISVRDGAGDLSFSGAVPFLAMDGRYTSRGVVKVPDARPRQLALAGFLLPTAMIDPEAGPVSVFPEARRPRLVLTAFAAGPGQDGLGLDGGVPQSVYQLDVSRLSRLTGADGEPVRLQLAPGESAELPGGAGTVTFDGLRRYAVLDVRSDPARGWVLGAALVSLAGLLLSLSVRRRRIWVRVADGGGIRTVVEVAGLARARDDGLAAAVARLTDAVAGPDQDPGAAPPVVARE